MKKSYEEVIKKLEEEKNLSLEINFGVQKKYDEIKS